MDFGKLKVTEGANKGAEYHVLDPFTEEPAFYEQADSQYPVTVTILGMDSDTYRKAQLDSQRRFLKGRGKPEPSDIDDAAIRITARCIVSWQGFFMDGEEIACNAENAYKLLKENQWLRDQLQQFQQDRRNFFVA